MTALLPADDMRAERERATALINSDAARSAFRLIEANRAAGERDVAFAAEAFEHENRPKGFHGLSFADR